MIVFGFNPAPDFWLAARGIPGVVRTHHQDGYNVLERHADHRSLAETPAVICGCYRARPPSATEEDSRCQRNGDRSGETPSVQMESSESKPDMTALPVS